MNKTRLLREQREKIVKGLELTYKNLIEFKKNKNSPLIISKNGEIIELDPQKAQPTTTYKWR
ncbi:MAG: sulfur carrier protein ThiS [Saprospiraceae bacterium]|jgi:sulfur carrier protein ThiS